MTTATPSSPAPIVPPAPRVLVAASGVAAGDDETLPRALRLAGLDAGVVPDPALGLARAGARPPDLVLIAGPSVSSLAQVRRLRDADEAVPVVALLTDGDGEDRAALLDAGADDALSSPVPLEALLAHVRAVLRRVAPGNGDLLTLADLTLRRSAREVRRAGRPLTLTRTEHDVLETLLARRGRVTSAAELARSVWGHDRVSPNAVAAHVSTLRRKLERDGGRRLVHTVHGVGYVARAPR